MFPFQKQIRGSSVFLAVLKPCSLYIESSLPNCRLFNGKDVCDADFCAEVKIYLSLQTERQEVGEKNISRLLQHGFCNTILLKSSWDQEWAAAYVWLVLLGRSIRHFALGSEYFCLNIAVTAEGQ